jgi:hypothetical protein
MQNFKLTTIIIAIIAIFASCKKDSLKTVNPKDFTSTNMKMDYYGKTLEYTVKYSQSTNIVKVEGKDATEVIAIHKKYPNAIALIENKNSFKLFNDNKDYYYNVLNESKSNARLINSNSNNIVSACGPIQSTTKFYQNDNYSGTLYLTQNTSTGCSPTQGFFLRQPCNDGTSNSCPTFYVSSPGIKNNWIGSSANDEITSFTVLHSLDPGTWIGTMKVTLYQDANLGGNAIAFVFPYSSTLQGITNLKNYKINTLLKTWNDRTSSYEIFY